MNKHCKRVLSYLLIFSFCFALISPLFSGQLTLAAKNPKLSSKSIKLEVNQQKVLTVKNSAKTTINWKSKNKKYVKVSKYKKNSAKVKGLKKGKTTVIATVKKGKKKHTLICRVEVKAKQKQTATPAVSPSVNPTAPPEASPSASPSASPEVSPSASPSASPEASPSVSPSTSPTAKPTSTPVMPPSQSGKPMETAAPTWGPTTPIVSASFEDGSKSGFSSRGSSTLTVVDSGYSGKGLLISDRTNSWNGANNDLSSIVTPGATYTITAWVKQTTGVTRTIACKYENNSTYTTIREVSAASGTWTKIDTAFTVPEDFKQFILYFEMYALSGETVYPDFYIDEITITLRSSPIDLQKLKELFSSYFTVGTAININQIQTTSIVDVVKQQYNSITMENEMKPDAILKSSPTLVPVSQAETTVPSSYKETQVPKLDFTNVDKALKIAKDNNIPMRGHCLVWHSQTPSWFFRENYSTSGALVSADIMNARMENYIKQVLYHVQTNYPDVVYAWDVVNEIFTDSGGGLRTNSDWYSIYKSDAFAVNAFAYARTYADSNVKLFYNDFNEYISAKTTNIYDFVSKVYTAGNIDGVGMQSHWAYSYPSVSDIQKAIEKFNTIDPGKIEIQLTEIDMTIGDATETQQAQKYKDIFNMLMTKKNAGVNITNVTFWGLYDEVSWRDSGQPLIFTAGFVPKEAYYKIVEAAEGK